MEGAGFIAYAQFALGVCVLCAGALAAWTSENVIKRVSAAVIVGAGALVAASAAGARDDILIAVVSVCGVQLAIGAVIAVRMQEVYDGLESPDIDAADAQAETAAGQAGARSDAGSQA